MPKPTKAPLSNKEVAKLYDGKRLEEIFKLQEKLMKLYLSTGDIPAWPLAINDKDNQKFLRAFVSRLVIELSEAYTEYKKIYQQGYIENNSAMIDQAIKEFNLEIADCTHFFIELYVLVGLTVDDFKIYYHQHLKAKGLVDTYNYDANVLRTIMSYARHENLFDMLYSAPQGYKLLMEDAAMPDYTYQAGRRLAGDSPTQLAVLLWHVVNTYSEVINLLKKKGHRTNSPDTDNVGFRNKLLEASISLFRAYDFMGLDEYGIWEGYKEVNLRNIDRYHNKI